MRNNDSGDIPSWCNGKKFIQHSTNCSDYNYHESLCNSSWYIIDSENDLGSYCIYNPNTELCVNNNETLNNFNDSNGVCTFESQEQVPELCRNKKKSTIPCEQQSHNNCLQVWVVNSGQTGNTCLLENHKCIDDNMIDNTTNCPITEISEVDPRCDFSKKQITIKDTDVSLDNIPPVDFDLCKLIQNDTCADYWYQNQGYAYFCSGENQCAKDVSQTSHTPDQCNNNNIVDQFDLKPDFCDATDKCFIGFECNSRENQQECENAWYSTSDAFYNNKSEGNTCMGWCEMYYKY